MNRSDLSSALLSAACIVLAIALVFSLSSNAGLREERDDAGHEQFAYDILLSAQAKLADELWSISSEVMKASSEMRGRSLGSENASEVLAHLADSNRFIVNTVAMNVSGYLVNAYPDSYDYVVGQYVGDHQATVEMMVFGKPVLSDVFSAVEGFEAAVIAYPVFDMNGTMTGSVTALIRTDSMMVDLFQGLLVESGLGLMVEQLDGRILYDTDDLQIGRFTFDDPLYQQSPSLLDLAEKVSTHYSGRGEYSFTTETGTFEKKAIWTSVTLHERSWRVLVYWGV
jgi:hypothetical protein